MFPYQGLMTFRNCPVSQGRIVATSRITQPSWFSLPSRCYFGEQRDKKGEEKMAALSSIAGSNRPVYFFDRTSRLWDRFMGPIGDTCMWRSAHREKMFSGSSSNGPRVASAPFQIARVRRSRPHLCLSFFVQLLPLAHRHNARTSRTSKTLFTSQ